MVTNMTLVGVVDIHEFGKLDQEIFPHRRWVFRNFLRFLDSTFLLRCPHLKKSTLGKFPLFFGGEIWESTFEISWKTKTGVLRNSEAELAMHDMGL